MNNVEFLMYYTNVQLIVEGGYPLNVNAWTDTKLTINDVGIPEIKQLKDRYRF